ncbi:f-box domain-containing protein [Trichonephila clavata]|uniref:F-box domain-containing protein n=1 Tax=Trichonephila clavata TaxID=2740835 RepID=A0A8X6FIL8_TRICU|nr:f-box domain-containing protein [Trichonephila clavata]
MSIQQVPAEILEIIFANLDGTSFCRAKQVCKLWCAVVHKLQNSKKIWRKFCIQDIPDGVIEELVSYKTIPYKNLNVDWLDIYKQWHFGKVIKPRHLSKVFEVQAFCSNPITCIATSGSWVVTGHNNGVAYVWSISDDDGIEQKSDLHLKAITDIALVDLLNLGTYYGLRTLPWSHHHMITVSKDGCIRISFLLDSIGRSEYDLTLHKHSDVINSVRIFGKQFAACSRDNTVTLWDLDVLRSPYLHLKATLLHIIIGPAEYIADIGFWNNKLYCITLSGKISICDLRKEDWIEKSNVKSICFKDIEKRPCITRYHTFRDEVVIMFTASAKMVVYLDENCYKIYHLMPTLQTLIVSIKLKGTILALGGENGKLYIFYVPVTESLLGLDLTQPAFHCMLSEASIVFVDVIYSCTYPMVVAATTEKLYFISWH